MTLLGALELVWPFNTAILGEAAQFFKGNS